MTTKNFELMKELAKVINWNPAEEGLEPHVEIDVPKVQHAVKRFIKDKGFEEAFTKVSGETLYNTLKKHPMGNLVLLAGDKMSIEDLLSLTKEGVQSNKLYPFGLDKAMGWVDANREVAQELYNMRQSGVTDFDMSKCILEVPQGGERSALNTILGSVKLPPIEELVSLAKDAGDKIKNAQEQAKAQEKVAKALEDDMKNMQSTMADLLLKAEANNKPVTLDASHDGTIPKGTTIMKKASEVFPEIKFTTDFEVMTWEWEGVHPHVPEVDPAYIFREKELTRVLFAAITNQRAYLQGHTGTGKTTLVEQAAARLGQPCIRTNFDSEISRMDLIGRDTLKTDDKGNVQSTFVDGILPNSMAQPCWFIADEIDFVRPDVAYVMQAALEGNGLRITEDGDRVVKPHPMFRMFATGNTVGQGDEFGMYQGARPQSIALLDRFTVWIKVNYLEKEQRETLIKRHAPTLKTEDVKTLSKYMDEHLAAFQQNDVVQPISPRGMLAVAKAATILGDLKEAMYMTILDRANAEDYATLKGIVDRVVA